METKSSSDVVIIGAGIIGCAIAYQLAKQGLTVTIVDRGNPGNEASSAAAGMLAPQAEATHGLKGPFSELCLASHRLYPQFVAEIVEQTGIEIAYRKPGTLFVATDYVEAEALAGLLERQRAAGLPAEELTADEMRHFEPALAETVRVGVYLPEDHHVDNRRLVSALVVAAAQRGVTFITHTPVIDLMMDGDRVTGVRTPTGVIAGGTIVNAAGSWAGLVAPQLQKHIPVRPIRGQMLCLKQSTPSIRHLVYSGHCYLVPWPDGRTLVGATMENVGYDKRITAQGINHLLRAALALVPSLAGATITEMWAGLRPGTPDDRPILGRIPGIEMIVATGHFRNGILLAPITAKLISELIVSGQPSISLEPFAPSRFLE